VNRVFLVTAAAIVGAGLLWFQSPPHATKPEVAGASPAEQINAQRVLSHAEKRYSRSHDAVIRVYDDAGNVIETHEHAGDFKEW
jgi:hypothetical protein